MMPPPSVAREALVRLAAVTGHDAGVLRPRWLTPMQSLVRLAAGSVASLVACAWCGAASGWAARLATDSTLAGVTMGLGVTAFVLCLVRLDVVGCGLPLGYDDESASGWRPALTPLALLVLLAVSLAQPTLVWLDAPRVGAREHYGARVMAAWEQPRRMVVRLGLLTAALATLLSVRRLDHGPTGAYERARARLYRGTVGRVHRDATEYAEAWCQGWCSQEPAREFRPRLHPFADPPFDTRPLPYGGYVSGSVVEGASWREAIGPEPEAPPTAEG